MNNLLHIINSNFTKSLDTLIEEKTSSLQSTINGVNSNVNRLNTVVNNIQNLQNRGTVKSVQRGKVNRYFSGNGYTGIYFSEVNDLKSFVTIDYIDVSQGITITPNWDNYCFEVRGTGTFKFDWQVIEFY